MTRIHLTAQAVRKLIFMHIYRTYIHTYTHTHTYIHTYILTKIHRYIHTYRQTCVILNSAGLKMLKFVKTSVLIFITASVLSHVCSVYEHVRIVCEKCPQTQFTILVTRLPVCHCFRAHFEGLNGHSGTMLCAVPLRILI
jgi:hypothetical protein